jgi:hypothetical protein
MVAVSMRHTYFFLNGSRYQCQIKPSGKEKEGGMKEGASSKKIGGIE